MAYGVGQHGWYVGVKDFNTETIIDAVSENLKNLKKSMAKKGHSMEGKFDECEIKVIVKRLPEHPDSIGTVAVTIDRKDGESFGTK